MTIEVHHTIESSEYVPSNEQFQLWVNTALAQHADAEIGIRLMSENEIQQLNQDYRQKNKATNILSFPYETEPLEGDLAICPVVVNREAKELNITAESHWAHIVIHGVLHLLGHDHETEDDAKIMEPIEIKLLAKLGYDNPYESHK